MLKLPSRELPLVKFRHALPPFLAGGAECFIEVDARAGGAINPAYVAAVQKMVLDGRVMDRKTKRIEDDQKFVDATHATVRAMTKARFAAIYDFCVIEWRSNIIDGDAPITCNRESFLELTEQSIPELTTAFRALEAEIIETGKVVSEEDDDTIKN